MRRRDYLAALGLLAGAAGTAGCLSRPTTGQRDPVATPPPPPERRQSTLTPDLPITVDVEPATASGPEAELRAHVRNRGDRPFRMQRHVWRLFKHVDGVWRHLAPKAVPMVYDAVTAPPGGRYTYDLVLDNTDLAYDMFEEDPSDPPDGIRMGPGRYRFAVPGGFVDPDRSTADRPSSDSRPQATVGGSFDVDGDPLPLPLTAGMTVADRSNGVATVVPASGPADPADPDVATLVVTRTDRQRVPPVPTPDEEAARPAGRRHLFVEELLTPSSGTLQSIRNALAAVEPATREVRLSTPNHSVPPFFSSGVTESFVYFRGTIYHLTRANWSWDDV